MFTSGRQAKVEKPSKQLARPAASPSTKDGVLSESEFLNVMRKQGLC